MLKDISSRVFRNYILEQKAGNIVFSPYSVLMLLGIAACSTR